MDSLVYESLPMENGNENIARIVLNLYKDEIRVRYLEEDLKQSQVLDWLNNDEPFANLLRLLNNNEPYTIKRTQLVNHLRAWGYFKNRSYLRPQRIRRNVPQAMQRTNMPGRPASADFHVDSNNQVLDADEVVELEGSAEAQFDQSAPVDRNPASSVSSDGNAKLDRWAFSDPTLAASVTSSQLTGLHSLRSMQRRIQLLEDEFNLGVGGYGSVSADATKFDVKSSYSEDIRYNTLGGCCTDIYENKGDDEEDDEDVEDEEEQEDKVLLELSLLSAYTVAEAGTCCNIS